jgi:hypothetical protein
VVLYTAALDGDETNAAESAVRDWSARAPGSPSTQAVVVGVIVGTIGYLWVKKKRNLPPGPFALPLLGSASVLLGKEPGFKQLAKMVER